VLCRTQALAVVDSLVLPGTETLDVRDREAVAKRIKGAMSAKQHGLEDVLCPLIAEVRGLGSPRPAPRSRERLPCWHAPWTVLEHCGSKWASVGIAAGSMQRLSSPDTYTHAHESSCVNTQLDLQACIAVCPKNPASFNVDNVRVVKIPGGGVTDSAVVRGMVGAVIVSTQLRHASTCREAQGFVVPARVDGDVFHITGAEA
jgi:hypothetical protein